MVARAVFVVYVRPPVVKTLGNTRGKKNSQHLRTAFSTRHVAVRCSIRVSYDSIRVSYDSIRVSYDSIRVSYDSIRVSYALW